MQDLNIIIAKYYLPDELFVGQVEEIIDMLTERLAERLPHIQAVNKANLLIAKYYLNIDIDEAGWSTSLQPARADHYLSSRSGRSGTGRFGHRGHAFSRM